MAAMPSGESPAPESPAPESPAPESPAPESPAPESPAPQSPAPESPAERPVADAGPSAARHKRFGREILIPFGLAILGLAMLLAAFILYPSAPVLTTPGYPILVIKSSIPLDEIDYTVLPASGSTEWIAVAVRRPYISGLPGANAVGTASLELILPTGTFFVHCPFPACLVYHTAGVPLTLTAKRLTFTSAVTSATQFSYFEIRAHNFGTAFNAVAAEGVIPQVTYNGPKTLVPALYVAYRIPSAASYDWSSFPPAFINGRRATWSEDIASFDTPSRVATGINHAGQASDDFKSFLAGALIALAGAVILAAAIEAVHARDWDVIRALRSK